MKVRLYKVYDLQGNFLAKGSAIECCDKLGIFGTQTFNQMKQYTSKGITTPYLVYDDGEEERETKKRVEVEKQATRTKESKYCEGCSYWKSTSGSDSCQDWNCHFLYYNQIMRGCPQGKGCTRRTKKAIPKTVQEYALRSVII